MHAGKMSDSPAVCTQSKVHGSHSRAPSVVCSWARVTKGAQRCPDDKAQDILLVLCKNWVNGIDSADSAVGSEVSEATFAAARLLPQLGLDYVLRAPGSCCSR